MDSDYSTFRVESSYRGDSCIEDDMLLHHKALALARDVWKHKQPLDWVRTVNERTGATCDEISRDTDVPTDNEAAGMSWWNRHTPEQRLAMLESPMVGDNPTAAKCYEVFGG